MISPFDPCPQVMNTDTTPLPKRSLVHDLPLPELLDDDYTTSTFYFDAYGDRVTRRRLRAYEDPVDEPRPLSSAEEMVVVPQMFTERIYSDLLSAQQIRSHGGTPSSATTSEESETLPWGDNTVHWRCIDDTTVYSQSPAHADLQSYDDHEVEAWEWPTYSPQDSAIYRNSVQDRIFQESFQFASIPRDGHPRSLLKCSNSLHWSPPTTVQISRSNTLLNWDGRFGASVSEPQHLDLSLQGYCKPTVSQDLLLPI